MSYITESFDDEVVRLLQTGGVGLLPTDTIYGLSCLALDERAVERIYSLKERDLNKPFIILIAEALQLKELNIDAGQTRPMNDFWPGAISLECTVNRAPAWLNRGKQHEAIRIPGNEALRKLIKQTGPIVSTSPNPQGKQPAGSLKQAMRYFGDRLDFYVDVGDLSNRQSSTLVKVVDGKLEVIRQGAVKIT